MFAQLVCEGCRKVLTYPNGALSCRCRNCNTVNAAQNLAIRCPFCTQNLLTPINTLTLLCPCCATVIDIPESMLPHLEEPVDIGGGPLGDSRTMYVSFPARPMTEKEKAEQKKMEKKRRRREWWERENLRRRLLKQPPLPPLSDSSADEAEEQEDDSQVPLSTSAHAAGAGEEASSAFVDHRSEAREETEALDQTESGDSAPHVGRGGDGETSAAGDAPGHTPSPQNPSMASAKYPLTVVIATRIL